MIDPSDIARLATADSAAPVRLAVIDLAAVRHNVRVLRDLVAPARVMVAVKADAYGHGMLPVAQAALDAGADSLAVLDIPAALRLREAGIQVPVFAWMHDRDADFAAAVDAGLDLGISAVWQLDEIARAGRPSAPRVHLKVDTGLSRNGATEADWPELVRTALALHERGVVRLHAAWSHLADASPEDDAIALARFHAAVEAAESLGARFELLHIAASSAGIRFPEARLGLVRFGIAVYGISPFDDASGTELGLRPVMTLCTTVAMTKRVPAGHGVSYGLTYRAERETTLALVPLGYADGIPRISSGRGQVWIGGSRHPVVGRVAMDQIVADVGDLPVRPGDPAIVFGEPDGHVPTAEDWAEYADTIGDEIVVRIGQRVDRVHLNALPTIHSDDVRLTVANAEEMRDLGRAIGRGLGAGDVVLLTGELGAGKTTLTQGIGDALGVRGPVTSPTFVLARTHPSLDESRPPLVHVDAYRLSEPAELDDLDLDFASSVTVVEWGRGVLDPLVDEVLEIAITRDSGEWSEESEADPRTVTIRRLRSEGGRA